MAMLSMSECMVMRCVVRLWYAVNAAKTMSEIGSAADFKIKPLINFGGFFIACDKTSDKHDDLSSLLSF